MMSRRDYQAIASALAEARMSRKERLTLAVILADVMAKRNVRFNKEKFLIAAGVVNQPVDFKLEEK